MLYLRIINLELLIISCNSALLNKDYEETYSACCDVLSVGFLVLQQ